jgi:cytochrome c-type biogenesis protein CcmE
LFKNKKFIIGGVIVFAAIGVLAFRAISASAISYRQVDEVVKAGSAAYGQSMKLPGFVLEGSVEKVAETATLRFVIADQTRSYKLPVVYQGVVPDTFKEGGEIVCEGTLNSDGTFHATTLLAKCPSKYTPASTQSG